jgi:DNA-binding CsgD family transcriptional regulator
LDDDKLIDRIYEAGVLPELWSGVLDDLTVAGNGAFAALFSQSRGDLRWVASKLGVIIGEEYTREGWPQRTDRMDRLLRARHAGFLGEAEARVARGIAERQTVEAIADSFGISRETVRAQLRAVRAKTGLARQADLAALLTGLRLPGE